MKHCVIILLILCSLFNKLYGQTPSAAIDSLIKYRVITIKERKMIDSDLKAKDYASYRVVILGSLKSIMIQKTFHINLNSTYSFSYSNSPDHLDKKKQDSTNTSLRLLLYKIKKSGLLTDRVYFKIQKKIDCNSYVAEVQIFSAIADLSYRFEKLSPEKLQPVAKQLYQYGILSDSSFSRLENDIRNEKIESTLQLNNYFKLDREIDLHKYPEDPHVWLELVYRDISSIIPGLAFTNFNYTTSPHTGLYGAPEIQYIFRLTCNGRIYKHRSSIFDFKRRKGKVRPIDFFTLDFERIFNKILADERSPYRLHCIMFSFKVPQETI